MFEALEVSKKWQEIKQLELAAYTSSKKYVIFSELKGLFEINSQA